MRHGLLVWNGSRYLVEAAALDDLERPHRP